MLEGGRLTGGSTGHKKIYSLAHLKLNQAAERRHVE
jgi:hypothetical protein